MISQIDLKFPYKWQERRPLLQEQVFYVPSFYKHHDASIFPDLKNKEIHVEFCSGNGEWVISKAMEFSNCYWIAVEKQFKRVRKIWAKMRNAHLENLLIVCGEAQSFTEFYLPSNCISHVYINFPDPWPKKRHAKHRLIQSSFAYEMARISKPFGKVMVVTDDEVYSKQVIEEMAFSWKPAHFSVNLEDYGSSYFGRLWKNLGRKIHYMEFLKE